MTKISEAIFQAMELQKKMTPYLFTNLPLEIELLEKQKLNFLESLQNKEQEIFLINHFYNARLWAFEDKARDRRASDKDIAEVKRSIDLLNQKRNDQVEIINKLLVTSIKMNHNTPLYSETPGSILDRNSIMTLKAFHLNHEISASNNSEEHQKKCHNNLLKVNEQISDLQTALKHFFLLIEKEEIHFKLYGQYKMYNDPNFNPYLKSNN